MFSIYVKENLFLINENNKIFVENNEIAKKKKKILFITQMYVRDMKWSSNPAENCICCICASCALSVFVQFR